MDAGTLSIAKIFGQERRHLVPLFQRPYVWTREEQWEPLWDDLRGVAEKLIGGRKVLPHFLGAIVLDQMRKPTGHIETRLLVDGQQRLTTIQLFLEAFADICGESGKDKHHRALLKLTRNDDPLSEDEDEQFKVWPTTVDQEHFRRVMRAASPADVRELYDCRPGSVTGRAIPDAYFYFHDALSEWLLPDAAGFDERLEAMYRTVRELVRMVVIDLGSDDDAQLIFETLNARGTPLLPSDLVKNHLFHLAGSESEDSQKLYDRLWKPFDEGDEYWRKQVGRGHAKRARIDLFLMNYLTAKTLNEVAVAHLYTSFKEYAREGGAQLTARQHMEGLHSYARVYRGFEDLPDGSAEAVFFQRLGVLEIAALHPFLMELFVRHSKEAEEVRRILADLESFLVRRMICQLNTRGYNRLFVDMLSVFREEKPDVHAGVREFLLSSEAENSRWPKDSELRTAWMEAPVYRVLARKRTRMLLEALEEGLRSGKTERTRLEEKLTIEHLLPQAWREHWHLPGRRKSEDESSRREVQLHSMGNLTLLTKKLNPAVSNGPWDSKREEILHYSGLRLNQMLRTRKHWDEDEIRGRGEELFAVACRVWPRPE